MILRAGTSGYSYAPWKGVFYPKKLPAAKMLAHYATQLPTVEINNTFYRMPKPEVITKWGEEVPADFRFAIKAPQRITHQARLSETANDAVEVLAAGTRGIGEKLGPVLFQLPPFMRKDLGRLQSFLETLKTRAAGLRPAFEFRHASWFEPDVFEALAAGGAALCISEADALATPLVATTGWGYLRLRRQDYGPEEVAAWADRIAAQPWGEAYVFFKHEDEGKGPALAAELLARSQNARGSAADPPA